MLLGRLVNAARGGVAGAQASLPWGAAVASRAMCKVGEGAPGLEWCVAGCEYVWEGGLNVVVCGR